MEAGASYPPSSPMDTSVVVVSSSFCTPYIVDLAIVRKLLSVTEGNFAVTDINGNIIFKIKGSFSIRDRRVLLDLAGNTIVSLQQKIITAHRRWQVFRGDSSSSQDLIFSAKKSSLFQLKTELHVFLASNTKEDAWDFKVKGSWLERSCTVYARGEENVVVARLHKKHSVQSIVLGKDHFNVTVYPNVDHAFIVALIVILEEINEDRSGDDKNQMKCATSTNQ